MGTRRRFAIGAGATALLCSGAALGAWFWWGPEAVRERAAQAAARRGLTLTVAGVDLGWERVLLRGVHAHDPAESLRLEIDEVRVDGDLWGLATRGTAAVRLVTIRGATVRVNLEKRELRRALRDLRGADASNASTEAVGGVAVVVEALTCVVRDRRGVLARLDQGRLSLEPGGSLQVSAGPIEVAPNEADGIRIDRARARAERTDRGRRITSAMLTGVAVRYEEREPAERSPLRARLRRAVSALSEQDGDEATAPSSVDETEDDGTSAALIARARDIIDSGLTESAVLQVAELSVVATAAGRSETVLRELEADVRLLPQGRLQLNGSGRPGRGGRLGWRLTVDPDQLRAEGRVDLQRLPFVLVTPFLPALPWHRPEDARVSGELSVEGRGNSRVHLDGSVTIDELALASPRIAVRPVQHIAIAMNGQADWDPATRRLDVSRASMTLGSNAAVQITGSVEWPEDHYLVDVQATLPLTDCNAAVGAIPGDLLDDLRGFGFRGRIAGRVHARVDSRQLESSVLDIAVADGCQFETAPAMADVRRFQAPFVHRVLEPDGTTFEMQTGPGTASWTPIREISPFLIHAVLGHEDGGFFSHHGFADHAIQQALVRNLQAGRYVYGASTITMQLVKNVFLHREKTLARKVQEVLLTWWVESVMTKEQILELYLNVIEYGPGVYGIRNAAEHYFRRSPAELGPAESAYLASILPNPKAYHSHWEQRQLPESFRRRVARFLQILGSRRRYDAEAVALGIEQLGRFRFHGPGDPLPEPPETRGSTAPLPFGVSLEQAWQRVMEPEAAEEPQGDAPEHGAEEEW
jgi:hypothetical protein